PATRWGTQPRLRAGRRPQPISLDERPCGSSRSSGILAANASAISRLLSSVGQPDAAAAAHGRAVLVGLEADRADAVGGELLVALLSVAGDADCADDLARGIANLQTAALGKDLFVGRGDEIAHEDRLLLGAHLHELGGAPHGERGISLAVGH